MHLRCDDLSASQRRYSLAICFGSFGSLFINSKVIDSTVYKDSVTPCRQLYPRRFLERDKMTQMTQSRGIPWAPDLRLLGHLGQQKTNDPNDPMTCACWRQLAI